jgi:dihydroneopterin aldolase
VPLSSPLDPRDGRDRIELRGLRLVGICGLLAEERERPQPLELDLDVYGSFDAAAASDSLADTVDYGAVCDAVAAVVENEAPELLEHLAERVAAAVLGTDPVVDAVTVSVRKLRPPVPHHLASSGVRIHRARSASPG